MAEKQPDLSAIMDKIAHLKALEERPGTPEEAANATAAIQRLMFRYNLDQAMVDSATRQASGAYGRMGLDLGSIAPWRRELFSKVCEFNFAKPIYASLTSPTVSVVGQKHNIITVIGMYDFLQTTIQRLADEDYEDQPVQMRGGKTRHEFSFGTGAAQSVIDRLQAQWDASRSSANNETGLVVLTDELDAAFTDFYPDIRYASHEAEIDYLAFANGVKAGDTINLAKQVEA